MSWGRGPSTLPRFVGRVWAGAQARCLLIRGVGWAPGTSAAKPGREHCRGHVAAGEDPVPARPGSGLWLCSSASLRLGLSLYPEVLDPTQARALPIDRKALENSQVPGSPFYPRAFGKTQHHLTLPQGRLPLASVLSASLGPPREAALYSLSTSGREATPWCPLGQHDRASLAPCSGPGGGLAYSLPLEYGPSSVVLF